jgi:hypothetical protein
LILVYKYFSLYTYGCLFVPVNQCELILISECTRLMVTYVFM